VLFVPIEILLVEDNSGDVQLTKLALEESKMSVNLHVVEDGVEALAIYFLVFQQTPDCRTKLLSWIITIDIIKNN